MFKGFQSFHRQVQFILYIIGLIPSILMFLYRLSISLFLYLEANSFIYCLQYQLQFFYSYCFIFCIYLILFKFKPTPLQPNSCRLGSRGQVQLGKVCQHIDCNATHQWYVWITLLQSKSQEGEILKNNLNKSFQFCIN